MKIKKKRKNGKQNNKKLNDNENKYTRGRK